MALLAAHLVTPYSLDEKQWVQRIVDTWKSKAPSLFPEFADYRDPPRRPIGATLTDEDLTRLRQGWFGRRVKPRLRFSAGYGIHHQADVDLELRPTKVEPFVGSVLTWTDAMASLLEAQFGFVHVLTSDELRTELGRPDIWRPNLDQREAGAGILMAWSILRQGLPTLYWRTYFGRPYVDVVGEERIRHLPAFRVEEGPWGFVVQLTKDPPGTTPWPEFLEAREATIEALGCNLFRADRASYFTNRPCTGDIQSRVPSEFANDFSAWPIDH